MLAHLAGYRIILASNSPRRRELMHMSDLPFETCSPANDDESYPEGLSGEGIARFLAEKKADSLVDTLGESDLVITADTIVWVDNQVLGKPENEADAWRMLRQLSGKEHDVITGVCLLSRKKRESFVACTKVFFRELADAEINYYISRYKPFDKAGAYGIQEWIGMAGIERIEGSYFNVVGLPIHQLYQHLKDY